MHIMFLVVDVAFSIDVPVALVPLLIWFGLVVTLHQI